MWKVISLLRLHSMLAILIQEPERTLLCWEKTRAPIRSRGVYSEEHILRGINRSLIPEESWR